MISSQKLAILVPLVIVQLGSCWGFQCITTTTKRLAASNRKGTIPLSAIIGPEEDDFPPEEEGGNDSNIDWDSEWKKVVQNDGKLSTGEARPGKDYYKSEAEIATIKAANKAAVKASEVSSSAIEKLPQLNSFTGDWKFWIGILVIVSVGLSVLSAPPSANILPGPDGTGGGYYI